MNLILLSATLTAVSVAGSQPTNRSNFRVKFFEEKESKLYLKTQFGLGMVANKSKFKGSDNNNDDDNNDYAQIVNLLKHRPGFLLDVGVGYKFNDWLRTDFIFTNYSTDSSDQNVLGTGRTQHNIIGKRRFQASTNITMLNGYLDIPITEVVGIYVNTGLGMALIHEKLKWQWDESVLESDEEPETKRRSTRIRDYIAKDRIKKTTRNFAYMAGIGSSFKVSPNLIIDLAYSFRDLGKSKLIKEWGELPFKIQAYRIHACVFGLRLEL